MTDRASSNILSNEGFHVRPPVIRGNQLEGFGDSGVSGRFVVMKKGDYPPPKFIVCHDDQCCTMVPVRPIYGSEIMW